MEATYYIPEDTTAHDHCCVSFKPYMLKAYADQIIYTLVILTAIQHLKVRASNVQQYEKNMAEGIVMHRKIILYFHSRQEQLNSI
jgi:hypothetical protein